MQTVVELPTFVRQAAELLSEEEKTALIDSLASNPLAGDEIPGTGGVRKIRVGLKNKGKRGGGRAIYYWYSENAPLYMLLIYGKNQKTDLSPEETRMVRAFAEAIKAAERKKRK